MNPAPPVTTMRMGRTLAILSRPVGDRPRRPGPSVLPAQERSLDTAVGDPCGDEGGADAEGGIGESTVHPDEHEDRPVVEVQPVRALPDRHRNRVGEGSGGQAAGPGDDVDNHDRSGDDHECVPEPVHVGANDHDGNARGEHGGRQGRVGEAAHGCRVEPPGYGQGAAEEDAVEVGERGVVDRLVSPAHLGQRQTGDRTGHRPPRASQPSSATRSRPRVKAITTGGHSR